MFDDDDDDDAGGFGMIMGLILFLAVGGLLFGSNMKPTAYPAITSYAQPR